MAKRFWRITGHKGADTIVDITIPVGSMTESQLQALLRCFAAKEELSYEVIVGAYVKRNSKQAHEFLQVQKWGPYQEYSCGNDPMFVATIVDEQGNRIKYPALPFAP